MCPHQEYNSSSGPINAILTARLFPEETWAGNETSINNDKKAQAIKRIKNLLEVPLFTI
jgi:hypothetical protein